MPASDKVIVPLNDMSMQYRYDYVDLVFYFVLRSGKLRLLQQPEVVAQKA
jgi:hypothetical protein